MNIVTKGIEFSTAVPCEVVGIELDGLYDALNVVRVLGAYSMYKSDTAHLDLPGVDDGFAGEALTIQAQLLRDIANGSIGNDPFGLRVQDATAGLVLRNAVNRYSNCVDGATKRSLLRFRRTLPSIEASA